MNAKETIEIEALLRRAYGQYRVHKVSTTTAKEAARVARRSAPSGFAATMEILMLGTRVDTSGAGAKLAGLESMLATTPDDLLIVHDHVLALSDWLIEGAESVAPAVWKRQDIVANGWRIEKQANALWLVRPSGPDGAGRGHLSRLTDPHLTASVILHAANGSRPECRPARRGRLSAAEEREVRIERSLYAVWHAALGVLAAELDGVLAKHAVLPPSATPEPWLRRPLRDVPAEEALSAG